MSDIPESVEWSDGIELILKKEAETCQSYFWLHNRASRIASRNNDAIQIPAIILQTVTGFLSATSNLVPPIALGAVSIFTGILSTVLSYYKFSAKAESNRLVAALYLKIYKNLEVELSLPPEQRMSPTKLLIDVKDKLDRISEIAPEIPDNVIALYKKQFADNNISKPIIANGLDAVVIYKERKGIESPKPKIGITFASTPK
jgi:hypothetical protein